MSGGLRPLAFKNGNNIDIQLNPIKDRQYHAFVSTKNDAVNVLEDHRGMHVYNVYY